MRKFLQSSVSLSSGFALLLIILIFSGFVTLFYQNSKLKNQLTLKSAELDKTSSTLKNDIANLELALASSTSEKQVLSDFLIVLKARNTDYENTLTEKENNINNLKKLTETDQELLQKYSKVYFLSENYVPSELSFINEELLFRKNRGEQIHSKVRPYLENLIRAAREDRIDLSVLSGYRSFEVQAGIKSRYSVIYGEQSTNRFSADQGYSEHQLGTTVDFTSKKTGESLTGFEKTPAYSWLLQNAHKFGFVISYPENNAYYIFEPWHFRFVGVSLAGYLYAQKKHFYDLSQRDIDPYLIKIFD